MNNPNASFDFTFDFDDRLADHDTRPDGHEWTDEWEPGSSDLALRLSPDGSLHSHADDDLVAHDFDVSDLDVTLLDPEHASHSLWPE